MATGTEVLYDDAPLNDPDYSPAYPPVDGRVPPEVGKFGPRSQLRWFTRYFDVLRDTSGRALDGYYVNSTMHTGACCGPCTDDEQYGYFIDDACCCRAN